MSNEDIPYSVTCNFRELNIIKILSYQYKGQPQL